MENNKLTVPGAIILAGALIALAVLYKWSPHTDKITPPVKITEAVLLDGGHILPKSVEQMMLKDLIAYGVIDGAKLPQVTELNLLWAYGLANSNPVLQKGPIMDLRYGGPTKLASVGGWSVTSGDVMDHYAKHNLVVLTPSEQQLVEKLAKGIYRPCCGNSTYFPDCNHGMAMLGLLEYLASNGATEEEMWNVTMTANVTWFPDDYKTLSLYFEQSGRDIRNIPPKEILGYDYSSGPGFAKISSQVVQPKGTEKSGNSCGVDTAPAVIEKKQPSCGV